MIKFKDMDIDFYKKSIKGFGCKLRDVAKEVGVCQSYFSDILNGNVNMPKRVEEKLNLFVERKAREKHDEITRMYHISEIEEFNINHHNAWTKLKETPLYKQLMQTK